MMTIVCILFFGIQASHAQNANEWLRQKKTQKRYLVEQIAALKVYADYLKKGYNIVHGGLTTIENIKNGNFSLDVDFFDSRKNVKPAIRNSIKVANIVGYQAMIIRDFRKLMTSARQDGNFTSDEILYMGHVYANLLRACDASLADLTDVISSGKSEMTDDERLKQIDTIHEDMADKYAFVQTFSNEALQLAMNRNRDDIDTQASHRLNNTL